MRHLSLINRFYPVFPLHYHWGISQYPKRGQFCFTRYLARLISPPAMLKSMIWSAFAGALLSPTCTALPYAAASLATATCTESFDVLFFFWTITLPNDSPDYGGSDVCGASVRSALQDVCPGGILGWNCVFESDGTTALITFNSDDFCNSPQIDDAVSIATGAEVTINCP